MSKATSGFIYIWRDRKHKRYYIGSHWGSENDTYVCSSTWMRNAHKRRPEDFKRRVIARISISRTDLLIEEQRWLNMIKPEEKGIRYYNLMLVLGNWRFDGPHKEETKEKLRKPRSLESRQAQSIRATGKPHGTPDENGRIYKVRSDKGKPRKPYKRGNQYCPIKGQKRPQTLEQCLAKSLRQRGKPRHTQNEATRAKISLSMKKYRKQQKE